MLIKYTCGSKSQTLRICYPFQSTGRLISHRNQWSFCIYMIPLRDCILERNSCPGTRTRVNSHHCDLRQHNILWWYRENKCRAMRGNWSGLAPGRKSPRYHGKHPQIKQLILNYGTPFYSPLLQHQHREKLVTVTILSSRCTIYRNCICTAFD